MRMQQAQQKSPSPVLSWDATPEEHEIIQRIAHRAVRVARRAGVEYKLSDASMDINAVHSNGTPMRLQELLEADDFNFNHDVFGIRRHLDRQTGQLRNFFVPRFARRDANGR